jgi:putative membrane protein
MGADAPEGWHGADGVARRTSPLTVAVAGASMVFGVIALLVGSAIQDAITAAATSSDPSGSPLGLLLPGILLVGVGAVQVVRWATTTYAVHPTELVVDSGVLNREHRVFPFARIQQADTHENLIGQLVGLTEIKIDVAGAAGSNSLKLRLLDRATAVALRDHILQRRAELHAAEQQPGATAPGAVGDPGGAPAAGTGSSSGTDRLAVGSLAIGTAVGAGEREVLRIAPGRLAVGAATQSAVLVAVGVIVAGALWLAAFVTVRESSGLAGGLIAVLAVGAAVVVVVVTTGGTILSLFGFVVSMAGDDIHLRYGLLETRNLTVPRRRVQQVTVADNPLRRLLGLVEVHLHTAAAPGGEGTTRFTIPILDASAVDDLLRTLMGTDRWAVPALTKRSAAARRRAIVRRTEVVLAIVVVPAVALRPAGLVLLAAAALGVPWGAAAHRRAGHASSPTLVALAHGVLHHRLDLVPVDRVQSGRTTQSIFQRRLGLATVLLDVAGTRQAPDLWDLELDTAAALRREVPRLAAGPSA